MEATVSIKGVGDGLLLSIPEGGWEDVLPLLLRTIEDRQDFFRGASVALQLRGQVLGAADLGALRQALSERQIHLTAIISDSAQTQAVAQDLGLAIALRRPNLPAELQEAPLESEVAGEQAVLTRRTLRSGNRVHFPGHVIVIGDVNPGAEIIAGGNIVIWGRLRGVVHAGAMGDEHATVCALDLAPTQVRIADRISISPRSTGRRGSLPEVARLRDGQIVAEPWDEDRRKSST
jgi:septum site-determining protein MinC